MSLIPATNDEAPPVPPEATDVSVGRDALLTGDAPEKVKRHLAELSVPDAYDWGTLFPRTTGFGAAGDVKRRIRWLKGVEPRFSFLLFPEEKIEFVTKGMLNSFAEQYFMGIWSLAINHTVFLFTNYRVTLINSDGKGRPKVLMWQISYDKIARYGAGTLGGSIAFKLSDKSRYKFAGVKRADRKRLKSYVKDRLDRVSSGQFTFPSHAGRDPICPSCGTPSPPSPVVGRACAECSEAFIDPRIPALMSLAIPGLGDLYLGHRAIALFELLGFALLLFLLGSLLITDGLSALPTVLVALIVANGGDAAITYHIAGKGLLPKRLAWKRH